MCHKFNSQGLGLRILELMIPGPKIGGFNSRVAGLRVPLRFQVPGSGVSDPRVSGLRSQVPGSLVSGSQVPGSRVSESRVSGSQGPRSWVSGPDFRLCQVCQKFKSDYYSDHKKK